ncbi:TetR/AcrR family transcriptional regulator [Kineobactrum salinum]|uniref:TetR/AcrR family transcriptional regulator n=1 Tax=Kineobactrum salinum TaxID=2708301 RepID=A0A6C0TXS4_9GAMM|nr:TetR/AcrR family transcriptional regulator [Kineobactrum salinum]QIB64576.1 TetR/AcrR family transcriptional regulator [Kineobactrum salinum]
MTTKQTAPGRQGTRHGTATRSAGKRTAARLVQAARELLTTEPLEHFSMRAVADRAGVGLANLQYYFPRREDLARALYLDVGDRYAAAYGDCLKTAPKDPVERFRTILRWNLHDITTKSTRQFFIQLWTLLGSIDGFDGKYLRELYAIDIAQLSEHLGAIHPAADGEDIYRRATVIAAMIEGLLLLVSDVEHDADRKQALLDEAMSAALAIALSETRPVPDDCV